VDLGPAWRVNVGPDLVAEVLPELDEGCQTTVGNESDHSVQKAGVVTAGVPAGQPQQQLLGVTVVD